MDCFDGSSFSRVISGAKITRVLGREQPVRGALGRLSIPLQSSQWAPRDGYRWALTGQLD